MQSLKEKPTEKWSTKSLVPNLRLPNLSRSLKKFVLPQSFYKQKAPQVAKQLLGKGLYFKKGSDVFLLEITETEAYLGQEDPASHSHRGLTKRNWPMFEEGGTCYVYLCYGINHCINVVTERKGQGSAVLIRGARPILGVERIQKNRGLEKPIPLHKLLNGPGKLARGLGIDLSLNGLNYWSDTLKILDLDQTYSDKDILTTSRIGISKATELKLRFILKECAPKKVAKG